MSRVHHSSAWSPESNLTQIFIFQKQQLDCGCSKNVIEGMFQIKKSIWTESGRGMRFLRGIAGGQVQVGLFLSRHELCQHIQNRLTFWQLSGNEENNILELIRFSSQILSKSNWNEASSSIQSEWVVDRFTIFYHYQPTLINPLSLSLTTTVLAIHFKVLTSNNLTPTLTQLMTLAKFNLNGWRTSGKFELIYYFHNK